MASIFTQIIERNIPADIVFENEHAIAFLDINPKSEGHTLVVPKQEVAAFDQLPDEVVGHLARALKKVTLAVITAMGTPHYNLSLNNGSPAGQVVFHVHFHIIPRYEGLNRGASVNSSAERRTEIIAAIKKALEDG